jgi:putative nucleotidyltransferase with HDIG domain
LADLISEKLREDLILAFDDPNYRAPTLPTVALDVMKISAREDADVREIVAVLERDQMLAATVLRLVSSPLYAARKPITSLDAAVMRLGVHAVRDAVFEVALRQGVFGVSRYSETVASIAKHSTLTAYLTRIVCRHVGIPGDLAFICGLLHDVGFAGLLLAVAHVERGAAPPLHLLWRDVDALHERASLMLSERWGLPQQVVEVVGHHHHLHTGETASIAAAVSIADHLTEYFNASVVGPLVNGAPMPADLVGAFDLETALSDLGMSDEQLKLVLADAERSIPDIVLL